MYGATEILNKLVWYKVNPKQICRKILNKFVWYYYNQKQIGATQQKSPKTKMGGTAKVLNKHVWCN